MIPLLIQGSWPMLTGAANEPKAFESCALNTLPKLNVPPVTVNGTITLPPAQVEVCITVSQVIVSCANEKDVRNKKIAGKNDFFISVFFGRGLSQHECI
jgi:hypothetical protein